MIPYIHLPWGSISTFVLFAVLGVICTLALVIIQLRKTENGIREENYILPKVVISGVGGYLCSAIADALFKYKSNGGFRLSGITFYGGFIGAALIMFLLLNVSKQKTGLTVKQWFDLLTLPLIAFHFWGRIGCFFGGCCYGKPTDSFIGVVFPGNIHQGVARYPTQLFEAAMLLLLFFVLRKCRNKFENYVILYAVARFIIEFFRGDERGEISRLFSPSQVIAIGMIFVVLIYKTCIRIQKAKCKKPRQS